MRRPDADGPSVRMRPICAEGEAQACGLMSIGCPIFPEFRMKTRWLGTGVLGALLTLVVVVDQPHREVLFDGTPTAATTSGIGTSASASSPCLDGPFTQTSLIPS